MIHQRLQQLEQHFNLSTLQQLDEPLFTQYEVKVWVKRDDLLHPIISGNKWRKLKYCLNHALELNKDTLISMGGAYSNHLHALAYVGKLLNLKTRAFIRGERPKQLNPTLKDLLDWGMELNFVSRSDYRVLRAFKCFDALPDLKPNQYWLPEGGALEFALKGVGECVDEIKIEYDIICAPCGTGTTLAGIISAVPKEKQVLGFAALKGAGYLNDEIQQQLPSNKKLPQWQINLDYHFGGFAKTKPHLQRFMRTFEHKHNIPLETIYSGKMFYALYELIQQNTFKAGSKIIAIHTGGLQGKRGFTINQG